MTEATTLANYVKKLLERTKTERGDLRFFIVGQGASYQIKSSTPVEVGHDFVAFQNERELVVAPWTQLRLITYTSSS